MAWATDAWKDSHHEFVFFARSPPEKVRAAVGSELDPSVLLEAGFKPVPTPPPPAAQIAVDPIDIDLLGNAAHALGQGAEDFVAAQRQLRRLISAVPELFRCVELLLKAAFEQANPHALAD